MEQVADRLDEMVLYQEPEKVTVSRKMKKSNTQSNYRK